MQFNWYLSQTPNKLILDREAGQHQAQQALNSQAGFTENSQAQSVKSHIKLSILKREIGKPQVQWALDSQMRIPGNPGSVGKIRHSTGLRFKRVSLPFPILEAWSQNQPPYYFYIFHWGLPPFWIIR